MTCFELRAAIEDLKIRPKQLAAACGVKYVEVWRWVEGKTPVPGYVATVLTLLKVHQAKMVLYGERYEWDVSRRHVYRKDESFKDLAKRFHPDLNKRSTKAEMQFVLLFRP